MLISDKWFSNLLSSLTRLTLLDTDGTDVLENNDERPQLQPIPSLRYVAACHVVRLTELPFWNNEELLLTLHHVAAEALVSLQASAGKGRMAFQIGCT